MSEKTVRVCDVCGRVFEGVKTCSCVLTVEGTDGGPPGKIFNVEIDLCPKHRQRCADFMARGCSPLKGAK